MLPEQRSDEALVRLLLLRPLLPLLQRFIRPFWLSHAAGPRQAGQ
jgi:hypothetical protein